MQSKTYTTEDLKPESLSKTFSEVNHKDLVKEKYKYYFTLKYKGTKVYITNGIETKLL